jgi:hypothetical protein
LLQSAAPRTISLSYAFAPGSRNIIRHFRRGGVEKSPEHCPGLACRSDLVIHASAGRHGRRGRLLFGFLSNHRFGGHQEARN